MPRKNLKKGIFITFEGVEGCGKSTHAKGIFKHLKGMGYDCLLTREPGGTKIGEMIRRILLSPGNTSLNDITELFLFEANRSQVVDELIRPALKKKMIVICDRFFDATMAYQGYANGLDKRMVDRMNILATGGLKPDLTIILDINVKEGLRRAARFGIKDRMENKTVRYHNRVRRGYKDIARREPRRVKLISQRADMDKTQELIRREVSLVVKRYKAAR